MTEQRASQGKAPTGLIPMMFRATNRALTWGDRLVAPMGLTRWPVMAAITAAVQPQPVAWLARDPGADRQNVQRIVNDPEPAGLVAPGPGPHHMRPAGGADRSRAGGL